MIPSIVPPATTLPRTTVVPLSAALIKMESFGNGPISAAPVALVRKYFTSAVASSMAATRVCSRPATHTVAGDRVWDRLMTRQFGT